MIGCQTPGGTQRDCALNARESCHREILNLAQIQLNITSLVALTRQFLPELMASGRGGLINIGSTAAFQPVPIMALYSASKAFVLSFTEAIAYEARGSGLRVTALCPGATLTEFFDSMGTDEAAIGALKTPSR